MAVRADRRTPSRRRHLRRRRGAGIGSSGVRWLIDPIDGTVNFVLGLPAYTVSVAAEMGGRVVAGCVHNPETGELFRATVGGGAYLGGRRLTGPRDVPLSRAVIGTGFSYDAARRGRQGALVAAILPRIGDIRRIGSASLDLCFVSAGTAGRLLRGRAERLGLGGWSPDRPGGRLRRQRATGSADRTAGRCGGRRVCRAGPPRPLGGARRNRRLTDQHCVCAGDGDGVLTVPGGPTSAWVT